MAARAFPFILALILAAAMALPAVAELRRVQGTGQAVESGLGAEVTRRRALQEALIEAALSAGVDVNGFAASASSILTADQLVVRPSSRILGYSILSEGKSGDYYRVKVEAFVGEPADIDPCSQRPPIAATAYLPRLSTKPTAPVWMESFGPDVAKAVQDTFLKARNGKLARSTAVGHQRTQVARVAQDMDYASLTQGRAAPAAGNAVQGLVISSDLVLDLVGGDHAGQSLLMTLELHLSDATSQVEKSHLRIERKVHLGTGLPIRSLNQFLRKDRQKLTTKLLEGVAAEFDAFLGAMRCQPLVAHLAYAGGKLIVPLGAQDGLTRNMLAYTDRGDQPFLLFRISELSSNRAVLTTIDPMVDPKSLDGVPARFMDGVP
ncbi:MAG: hypothetical protein RIR14_2056 [Pseudomonadota bacterium]|jgi:hypothetical protein